MGIEPLKDGIRSNVRIDFYGHVHKRLRGTDADKRYAKEVEVLKVLEERGCPYVPRLLEEHPEELYFVSTNCGKLADQISKEKADKLFANPTLVPADEAQAFVLAEKTEAGDAFTTKPYVSGSNYLRKMSDFGPGEWREAIRRMAGQRNHSVKPSPR